MYDITDRYQALNLIVPQAATATVNGTAIDLGPGYHSDSLAILTIGAVTGTTPTLDVTIKGSDTSGGSYTTLTTFTQVTASTKIACGRVLRDTGLKRWIKAVATIGGTTPSFTFSVVIMVQAIRAVSTNNSLTAA